MKKILIFLFWSIFMNTNAQMMLPSFQGAYVKKISSEISSSQSNSLDFNGTPDYITLPSGIYFNGNFTIECWIYPKSFSNWSRIIDFGNGAGNNNVLLSYTYGTSGAPGFYVGGSQFQANTSLTLNQWNHVAATLNGTTATIFINGNAAGTSTFPVPANVTRNLNFIGRSNWGQGDPDANAIFDDLRIWNVARTQAEIQANMNNELIGNESGLLVYFTFNEGIACGNNTSITTITDKATAGGVTNGTLNSFTLSGGCTSNFTTGKVNRPADGLTSSNASSSALTIKQNYPNATDGIYWIKNANINAGTPFQIYADMTTDGGGWMLLNGSGGNVASNQANTVLTIDDRTYLPRAIVIELANLSTMVQLRNGPAGNKMINKTTSTDLKPIIALRASDSNGQWHYNLAYQSFTTSSGTAFVWYNNNGVANGWPNMFHSSGNANGVHWLPIYPNASGRAWDDSQWYSTWIK